MGNSDNRPRRTLGREIADELRRRILSGEFPARSRLPSEAELGAEYGVSRVTVRSALQLLQSRGLADIRHGSGTYVASTPDGIRAGLQELRSMTDTIRELGHEPSMRRHLLERRHAGDREVERLGLAAGDEVWAIERTVFADGVAVAFSHDVIPTAVIAPPCPDLGNRSVFAEFAERGIVPERAVAEVHAVSAADVTLPLAGRGDELLLLLDQLHETRDGQAVAYSRTYFVEGRFQFVILRTR